MDPRLGKKHKSPEPQSNEGTKEDFFSARRSSDKPRKNFVSLWFKAFYLLRHPPSRLTVGIFDHCASLVL